MLFFCTYTIEYDMKYFGWDYMSQREALDYLFRVMREENEAFGNVTRKQIYHKIRYDGLRDCKPGEILRKEENVRLKNLKKMRSEQVEIFFDQEIENCMIPVQERKKHRVFSIVPKETRQSIDDPCRLYFSVRTGSYGKFYEGIFHYITEHRLNIQGMLSQYYQNDAVVLICDQRDVSKIFRYVQQEYSDCLSEITPFIPSLNGKGYIRGNYDYMREMAGMIYTYIQFLKSKRISSRYINVDYFYEFLKRTAAQKSSVDPCISDMFFAFEMIVLGTFEKKKAKQFFY